jgi:hypothetical protein
MPYGAGGEYGSGKGGKVSRAVISASLVLVFVSRLLVLAMHAVFWLLV